MADAHKNFAVSLVATAPSPAASGTSLVVTASEGSRFPAVSFNATVWPAGAQPTPANAEIVRVTNISTDTFTITRAQESTSARTIVVGDQIAASVTAKTLTDAEAGTEIAGSYVEFTSPVSVTATVEASADTIVSAGAFTYDGSTTVLIEFYCPKVQFGNTWTRAVLFDGSSAIGWMAEVRDTSPSVYAARQLTPSAASHTYSIRAYKDFATAATWTAGLGGAGAFMPGFIRITRVT